MQTLSAWATAGFLEDTSLGAPLGSLVGLTLGWELGTKLRLGKELGTTLGWLVGVRLLVGDKLDASVA